MGVLSHTQIFSAPQRRNYVSDPQKFQRCKNVLEVLYRHAEFGGSRISPAAGTAKHVEFICLSEADTWHGGRCQPTRICVRWGPSPLPTKGHSPNFRPMSVMAKRLDGSRCHLVGRQTVAQVTLCQMDPAPHERGTTVPSFRPMSIVAKLSPILATAEHLFHLASKTQQACNVHYCMRE